MRGNQQENENTDLGYMTMREVCLFTTYSRSQIYRLEAKGLFPRRRKLMGTGKIGFLRVEVYAWARNRPCAPLAPTFDHLLEESRHAD